MNKRTKFKESRSPSQISGIQNYSKNAKANQMANFKLSQRKNRSELKLNTNYNKVSNNSKKKYY